MTGGNRMRVRGSRGLAVVAATALPSMPGVSLSGEPGTRQRVAGPGFGVAGTAPAKFRTQARQDATRRAWVNKASNIKVE